MRTEPHFRALSGVIILALCLGGGGSALAGGLADPFSTAEDVASFAPCKPVPESRALTLSEVVGTALCANPQTREVWANAFDAEVRIAEYAKFAVDVQVVSTVPVMFSYWAKPSQALELHRFLNDHTAEICRRYPRHYAGIGTVPLQAPTLAIQELSRCSTS